MRVLRVSNIEISISIQEADALMSLLEEVSGAKFTGDQEKCLDEIHEALTLALEGKTS